MTTVARIGKPEAKRDDIYEDWQAVGPTVTTVGGLASRKPTRDDSYEDWQAEGSTLTTVARIGKPEAQT